MAYRPDRPGNGHQMSWVPSWMWWTAIVVTFGMGLWPAALGLLFLKLFGKDSSNQASSTPPLEPYQRVNVDTGAQYGSMPQGTQFTQDTAAPYGTPYGTTYQPGPRNMSAQNAPPQNTYASNTASRNASDLDELFEEPRTIIYRKDGQHASAQSGSFTQQSTQSNTAAQSGRTSPRRHVWLGDSPQQAQTSGNTAQNTAAGNAANTAAPRNTATSGAAPLRMGRPVQGTASASVRTGSVPAGTGTRTGSIPVGRDSVSTRTGGQKIQETAKNAMRTPAPKKSNARRLTIAGIVLMLIGSVASWEPSVGMMVDPANALQWLSDLFYGLAFLIGGGAMFFKGRQMDRKRKQYEQYLAMMGGREAISIEELAAIAGCSTKQMEKDLRQMLEQGYFEDSAYLNMQLGYLFRNGEADRAWQAKQKAAQESETPAEAEKGYSGILRNIHRANDRIADPVLSEKISQLESITAQIFRAVEEDPKKAERIDTFLNYYLPTTQKLLDSYAQFESAGVEGENLSQAKQRIASTMDMIIKGFAHQLDQLYKADAIDIDTDIRVMESMFKQDAGTAADDFGLSADDDFGGGAAFEQKPRDP